MLTGTVLSLSVCQQDNSKGCGRIWITFCRPLAYGARTYVAPHPIYGERVTRGGGANFESHVPCTLIPFVLEQPNLARYVIMVRVIFCGSTAPTLLVTPCWVRSFGVVEVCGLTSALLVVHFSACVHNITKRVRDRRSMYRPIL